MADCEGGVEEGAGATDLHRIAIVIMALLLCATPATAQRKTPTAGKAMSDIAADVVRTTRDYRATLERALAVFEADVLGATEALEERRKLREVGVLSESHVADGEARLTIAQRNLHETREAIEEADRIIREAALQEQIARLAPLPRGGYEDKTTLVRFNGSSRWSLDDVPKLEQRFRAAFGQRLPISSFGQTKAHDQLGLDHRGALDVAVHPDSAEGRWLMEHLRQAGIPFLGVRSAVPGSSTGAHVHVGPPSARIATR